MSQTKNLFPIHGTISKEEGQPGFRCRIFRLEYHGVMFFPEDGFYKTGDDYFIHFELPGMHKMINQKIRIIKTYEAVDPYANKQNRQKMITVEGHFKETNGEFKDYILKFLSNTGNKEN